MKEINKLNAIALEHNTHTDFDGVLARYTGKIMIPWTAGLRVLECGCSTGVMTAPLLESVSELEIVEGSPVYAAKVNKDFSSVKIHIALFEDYSPEKLFDCLVVAGVIHHLNNPEKTLQRMGKWVKPGGKILISVPNMTSFHRQLGVAMGVVKDTDQTSVRNEFFKQPGRFTRNRLTDCVKKAGWTVDECYGFFFKPFPHDMMNQGDWSEPLLDGLFQMGLKYPDLACQLFLRAHLE